MSTFILPPPPRFKVKLPSLTDKHRTPTRTEKSPSEGSWIMVEATLPTIKPGSLHENSHRKNTYTNHSDDNKSNETALPLRR
jgi:hypothetical protein